MSSNISKSNQRNTLPSSDINRNLKNIKKDRYIHVKIFTCIVVILIGWFVYFLFTSTPPPPITVISKVESDTLSSDRVSTERKLDPTKIAEKKIKTIWINAADVTSLRDKLRNESERLMKDGEYTPVDPKLSISKKSFYCKLIKKRSGFIKLSLVWGPSGNCESCDNSIMKNPGSIALLQEDSGGFLYQVTAISE